MGIRIRTVDQLYILPDIHTEFTHNLWVSALWDAVMGDQTLVDVVASIFMGMATALQTIKKGLSKTWDGIKDAGQFVSNTVLNTIASAMSTTINLLVTAVSTILSVFLPISMVSIDGIPRISINGQLYDIGFEHRPNQLLFTVNGNSLDLFDLIFSTPDTLSVSFSEFAGPLFGLEILYTILEVFGFITISGSGGVVTTSVHEFLIAMILAHYLTLAYHISQKGQIDADTASFFSNYFTMKTFYLLLGSISAYIGSESSRKVFEFISLSTISIPPALVLLEGILRIAQQFSDGVQNDPSVIKGIIIDQTSEAAAVLMTEAINLVTRTSELKSRLFLGSYVLTLAVINYIFAAYFLRIVNLG